MTPDQIEFLLHEEEGTSLDFKRDQYKFEGANKEDKSELLKDILAFANAFRRTDAYILIGVEEIRASKNKVVGLNSHLNDAKLQQFVNSKTQIPVTFSYREVRHDGHTVGFIHIPAQTRPIYSTQVGTFRVCPASIWPASSDGHTGYSVDWEAVPLYLRLTP